MNDIGLRIIIIDDNPAIHQDFIKVLTTNQKPKLSKKLDDELFGEANLNPVETTPGQNEQDLPAFEFDTATQGQEGVEKIKLALESGRPYALAFVDIRMPPGWDGIETIQRIWRVDKDIQVVICTAYSDYSWEETIQKLGVRDSLLILKKPFDSIAVKQLACALSRKWLLARDAKNHTELLNRMVAERTESLQRSLSLLRATIESSADGILVLDLNKKIVDYNMQFVIIWNIPESILEKQDGDLLLKHMLEKLQTPDELLNQINYLYKHNDDSSVQIIRFINRKILECCSQPHRVNGVTVGRVWSFHDITQQSYLQQKLEYQASHDSLTNLPNRVLFNDRTQQAIAIASRHESNFAVLFLDLDRFKLVNDSLSHQVGDELLKTVAIRLSKLLRKVDTLARLGGDEFVMIIPDLAKKGSIVNVAQKILMSFEKPFLIAGREITMNTSIGISVYPTDGLNINTLLRNADLAMYQAKELGGNQFKFYTDNLNQQNHYRSTQEIELQRAITHNEFTLVYQPQIDINTHQLLSVEALIRWQHPELGEILPLDFIPTAEETGLIIPIGEWVIREVCQQIIRWRKNGLPYLRVAVNVANQQLKQVGFASTIKKILQEYKVKPQYLEIELTENIIITHAEVIHMIKQLKDFGITIVLDNVGTGSSSLNYLKQLQVDRLKIDHTFVQNIPNAQTNEVMMEAIMTMARNLNLKVVAEGVETKKQINFLKRQHCIQAQGYYLSKPLSPKDIESFFKEGVPIYVDLENKEK